jgi:hypothetical protein
MSNFKKFLCFLFGALVSSKDVFKITGQFLPAVEENVIKPSKRHTFWKKQKIF